MKSLFSALQKISLIAVLSLVLTFSAAPTIQAQDIYLPMPSLNFPSTSTSTFAGVTYANSGTYTSPMIDAWNYDSVQFPITFTDSVNISSIKVIRYAYQKATIGDTSSTLGTVVSTNSGGKTIVITSIDSTFTNKNACAGYLRLRIAFNSTGNPSGSNAGKKMYPHVHGYRK